MTAATEGRCAADEKSGRKTTRTSGISFSHIAHAWPLEQFIMNTVLLVSFLLIIATKAQEEFGSLFSRFDDGREEFLSGGLRMMDLGTFSSDKLTDLGARGSVRPGQTLAYKAKFTGDVSCAVIGIQWYEYVDPNGGNAILEVNMDKRRKPFLNGDNINTDTQCRKQKITGGPENAVCDFNTENRGDGTFYIWVTGKKFTKFDLYAVQKRNDDGVQLCD
jgi:hypothetical protein